MSTAPKYRAAVITAIVTLLVSAAGLHAALSALGVHLIKRTIHPADNRQCRQFPDRIDAWTQVSKDQDMSEEMVEELGTDNTISRWYKRTIPGDEKGESVQLHLAYYTGKIDTVPHVPERCNTAAGTKIGGETKEVPVKLDQSMWRLDPEADPAKGPVYQTRCFSIGRSVRLPRGIENLKVTVTPFIDDGGRHFYAGYFFIANGGTVPSAYGVRFLAHKLTDDYAFYMKVQFTTIESETYEDFAAAVGRMLDAALPEIMRLVPDWVEVEAGRYPPKEQESKP